MIRDCAVTHTKKYAFIPVGCVPTAAVVIPGRGGGGCNSPCPGTCWDTTSCGQTNTSKNITFASRFLIMIYTARIRSMGQCFHGHLSVYTGVCIPTMPWEGRPPPSEGRNTHTHPRQDTDITVLHFYMVNKLAVRILLECILVSVKGSCLKIANAITFAESCSNQGPHSAFKSLQKSQYSGKILEFCNFF